MATILESYRETSRRIALTIHPDGKPHALFKVIAEYRETILREAANRMEAAFLQFGGRKGHRKTLCQYLRNAILDAGDYK